MPKALQEAYLKVAPDPKGLQTMFERDVERMLNFKDIKDEDIRSIAVPALVLISDQDVVLPEQAVELYRLLPKGHLLVLPGQHGECLGEASSSKSDDTLPDLTVSLVETFLDTAQ
jgi:pimeloyl-ACP methyl ester carboxylesterase